MLQLDVSDRADLRNMFMHVHFVAATALLFVTFRNYSIQSCKLCSYTQFLDESHFILYHQLSTINKVQMTCDCLLLFPYPSLTHLQSILFSAVLLTLTYSYQSRCFAFSDAISGQEYNFARLG